MSLDRIFEELVWISERLGQVEDPDEQTRLEARRNELRIEARLVGQEEPRSLERVRDELRAAEARLDDLLHRRIDVVRQAGGSQGGDFAFTADAMKINREIDAAQDRSGLEARVRLLRAKLRELESDA